MKITDNALTVLKKRYFKEGEDWSKLVERVVTAITNNEQLKKAYYDAIYNLELLPNTPTLINAGTDMQQLSACYVLPVEDSIPSIFDAVKHAAIIHKSGGGTGFSFSKLREAGAAVQTTNGVSSGPVSFMRVFNEATGAIKQGGVRRGANMGILNIDHPDIEEFIKCKADTSQLTNFNISVGITDKFMETTEMDDDIFDLISPKTNSVTKQISAKYLLDQIAVYAHKNGEPGIIFLDRINRDNPTPYLGDIAATNPCFSGDCKILTEDGEIEFSKCPKHVMAIDVLGNPVRATIKKTGIKKCITLIMSDRRRITCTPDHVFVVGLNSVKAEDLLGKKPNIFIPYYKTLVTKRHNPKMVCLGFAQGDGELSRLSSATHSGIGINIGKLDEDMLPYFDKVTTLLGKGRRRYWPDIKDEMLSMGFSPKISAERIFPETYADWSDSDKKSFLCGCYSANGSVIKSTRVSYKTTSKVFAEQLSSALLEFGIESYTTRNKPKEVTFKNGTYLCRESYDVNIGKTVSIQRFCLLISFVHAYKWRALHELLAKKAPKVVSIDYHKEEQEVYDFSMDSHPHWGTVNGMVVHNCGEIPLLPNEACNLASINLNATIKDGEIWWEKLDQLSRIGTIMLNDIIDANEFPLPEIAEAVKATRKIGLGVMGWADMLIKLKIPYTSPEARALASNIMERIQYTAYKTSEELVKYFGAYPECNGVMRRNATVTCIAPTGTISMIAGCSSGIEPIFSLSYTKNVMDGEEIVYVNDQLKEDLEAVGIWSDKIEKEIRKTGSIQHIDGIPDNIKDVYMTSQEIDWLDHINMQAEFQRFCDNAVSKTINMSKNATVEDVKSAYLHAWKSGLKGITVYRDGSRESQVLSVGYKPKDIKYSKCPECSSPIEHAEGCVVCKNCGWAVCS